MFPNNQYYLLSLVQAVAVLVFVGLMWRYLAGSPHRLRTTILATLLYGLSCEVGAKAFWMLFKAKRHYPLTRLLDPGFYLKNGFWGWLLAFLPLVVLFGLFGREDRVRWFRAVSLTLPPIVALQKLSCFFAGCCYGRKTDLPWGVVFPHGPKSRFYQVPVHPLQIYDALDALLWLVVLLAVDRKQHLRPYLFPIFMLLYSVGRFSTETLRPEFRRGLTSSQLFELAALVGTLLLLTVGRRLWLRFLRYEPQEA